MSQQSLPGHWLSEVQGQLVPHVCAEGSQHWPATQSALVQQLPHTPLQQTWPLGHWSLAVQAQLWLSHCLVSRSQHWPARQSASEPQQAKQLPSALQQSPAAQSESAQHCLSTQASAQQIWPLGHSAEELHEQFSLPHWWDDVSQHWPARQSLFEQQAPHVPLQQLCPLGHWASAVQAQLRLSHCLVAKSQHWPARQSESD